MVQLCDAQNSLLVPTLTWLQNIIGVKNETFLLGVVQIYSIYQEILCAEKRAIEPFQGLANNSWSEIHQALLSLFSILIELIIEKLSI